LVVVGRHMSSFYRGQGIRAALTTAPVTLTADGLDYALEMRP
jgi:hypothetical protein